MSELNLPIFTKGKANDIQSFVDYWSQLYDYRNEEKYINNIKLKKYLPINILELFEWKNGSVLSDLKEASFKSKILAKIDTVNKFKADSNFNVEEFKEKFISVSAVWKIFLLHIIKPNEYPIYDQHIHRAYNYMKGIPFEQIKNTIRDEEKLNFYFDDYLTFKNEIEISDLKKMDEAFFAFGKLLNTAGYKRTII